MNVLLPIRVFLEVQELSGVIQVVLSVHDASAVSVHGDSWMFASCGEREIRREVRKA